MKINVLGSCVSRVSLLKGEREKHGIVGTDGLELGYFLDKHNIALAMMPAPFPREIVMQITEDDLWDKSRIHSLKQVLMKDTVSLLLESDAEYLVMDLYDFHNLFLIYGETAFATQAGEFGGTKLFKALKSHMNGSCFFEIPEWLYYPYVDLFFEKIMSKYDSDHIILNRFRANTWYLDRNGYIKLIPETSKQPEQCNDKYNDKCRALEEYIIKKYNPYVIDISQFFMGDENLWSDNLNGAHFEKEFYRETYTQIINIIKGKATERYFQRTNLFDAEREGYEEDRQRAFDVEKGIEMLEYYVNCGDVLWLNVLDKLYMYAPEDERVQYYIEIVRQEGLA